MTKDSVRHTSCHSIIDSILATGMLSRIIWYETRPAFFLKKFPPCHFFKEFPPIADFFFLKASLNYSFRQGYCHILAIGHAERIIRSAQALAIIYRVYNGNTPCGTNNFLFIFLNPPSFKFFQRVPPYDEKIEQNPGLWLVN